MSSPGMTDQFFEMLDTDKDGYLSLEEIEASTKEAVKKQGAAEFDGEQNPGPTIFQKMDTDGDGRVSKVEASDIVNMILQEHGKASDPAKGKGGRGAGGKGGRGEL